MNKDEILSKIDKLLKLSQSSNSNEADNAKLFADKLISKYGITEEELKLIEEKKPLYGENEKLFHSSVIVAWKNQLAFGLAVHFGCYIVQEQTIPADGESEYDYFVYGDSEDVQSVKLAFLAFENKINNLISSNCYNKGPVYISSYCEGVVQSIRSNLEIEGLEMPKINKNIIGCADKMTETPTDKVALAAIDKETKDKPVQASVDVNNGSMIRDIMAFLKGLKDGKDVSLQDTVESKGHSI